MYELTTPRCCSRQWGLWNRPITSAALRRATAHESTQDLKPWNARNDMKRTLNGTPVCSYSRTFTPWGNPNSMSVLMFQYWDAPLLLRLCPPSILLHSIQAGKTGIRKLHCPHFILKCPRLHLSVAEGKIQTWRNDDTEIHYQSWQILPGPVTLPSPHPFLEDHLDGDRFLFQTKMYSCGCRLHHYKLLGGNRRTRRKPTQTQREPGAPWLNSGRRRCEEEENRIWLIYSRQKVLGSVVFCSVTISVLWMGSIFQTRQCRRDGDGAFKRR